MISLKTLEQGYTGSDQFMPLYPVMNGKLNSMVAYKFNAFSFHALESVTGEH